MPKRGISKDEGVVPEQTTATIAVEGKPITPDPPSLTGQKEVKP